MAKRLLVVTGGGSGGHIYPALAVAREAAGAFDIAYIGARGGMEETVVPEAGVRFYAIPAGGIAGKGPRARLIGTWRSVLGLARAFAILGRLRPAVVFGTGGYVSGPVGLAARLRRVPLAVLEPDARLGVTNTLLSRLAVEVYLGFPGALPSLGPAVRAKAIGTGIPVRPEVGRLTRQAARRALGLDSVLPTVLAFGGSLGSKPLNDAVARSVAEGATGGLQLIWGTGRRYAEAYPGPWPATVRCLPYIEDLPVALSAADLVVARAGAVTIAELAVAGRAAILVPSAFVSDDQQFRNAALAKEAGGAVVLTDRDLAAGALSPALASLMADAARLSAMGGAMRQVVPAGAAAAIAGRLVRIAGEVRP